jgi:hypothetical protein
MVLKLEQFETGFVLGNPHRTGSHTLVKSQALTI